MNIVGKAYHAVLVTFQTPVVGLSLQGRIFDDTHTHGNHPFPDGSLVCTTPVLRIEGGLVHTRNTVYLIREPE